MEILLQLLLLILGFALLIKGADWFVEGASKIADKFHIPQIVIGLTIVAFGTSAPEAAISISAAFKGNADLSISNVVGSNILNVLLILGITSLVLPLFIQKSTLKYELPFVIIVTALLPFLGMRGKQLSFIDGIVLWIFFLLFFFYLCKLAQKGQATTESVTHVNKTDKLFTLIIITVLGIVCIVIGSDIAVDSATKLAKTFGLSERFIGLTIVAFGTSLPELITSVTAALKKNADIAIGNVIGSNIFNILFVLGTSALITPISFSSNFLFDCIIAIGAVILLLICVLKKQKLGRISGSIMLVSYLIYFVYILSNTISG